MRVLDRFTSLEEIADLVQRYTALPFPKERPELFLQQLTSRLDAWFVRAGDEGLIYLTDLAPGLNGNLRVLFWDDGPLSERRLTAIKRVIVTAFDWFHLARVTLPVIHETGKPVAFWSICVRKLGFVSEGRVRAGTLVDGTLRDVLILGMLREEVPWPSVVPMPSA